MSEYQYAWAEAGKLIGTKVLAPVPRAEPPPPGKVGYQRRRSSRRRSLRGQPRKAAIAIALFQDKIEQLKE